MQPELKARSLPSPEPLGLEGRQIQKSHFTAGQCCSFQSISGQTVYTSNSVHFLSFPFTSGVFHFHSLQLYFKQCSIQLSSLHSSCIQTVFISIHFTSLQLCSNSVHFNSLHFSCIQTVFNSLHFTSLQLHSNSVQFTSVAFKKCSIQFTSLHFTSLHFSCIQTVFTSIVLYSLHFSCIQTVFNSLQLYSNSVDFHSIHFT